MKKTSRDKFLKHFLVFFSFIIITFYCSMLTDSFVMELKTFGRCPVTLTKTECKTGPYPKSSYKWNWEIKDWSWPTGCIVRSSNVFFNTAVHSNDCTSKNNCLCKKGKLQFYLFLKVKFYIILHYS